MKILTKKEKVFSGEMQSATQLVSKILREETKKANENLFCHSSLIQAKSGEVKVALCQQLKKLLV